METFFDCEAETSVTISSSFSTNLIIHNILKILALNFVIYNVHLRIRMYAEGE
jgi:hypothetical protein